MAKKGNEEIIGEFIIGIDDHGSISVNRIYKSTMKALKEIWEGNDKGEAPKDWNTQDLGRHITNELCGGIKNTTIGEYAIEREDNQRINVIRRYSVAKEGLRDCADSISFQYDNDWTTRQFGQKLIDFYLASKQDKK